KSGRVASFLIDHLARHAAVDHEIGSGDEAGALAVQQPAHEFGDILWPADSASRMLAMILPPQRGVIFGFDPAGADGIDTYLWRETDGERVRQCEQSAFTG